MGGPPVPLKVSRQPMAHKVSANPVYSTRLMGGKKAFLKMNRPDHPFLCMNEWVSGCLGLLAGFSLLPISQVQWRSGVHVAWPYLEAADYLPGPVAAGSSQFAACSNSGPVPYEAVALDAWIANPDRHDGNVVIVIGRKDLGVASSAAFLTDHDRACFHLKDSRGGTTVSDLTSDFVDGWVEHMTAWVRQNGTYRLGVVDQTDLAQAVAACVAVPEAHLKKVIEMAPLAWASVADRARLLDFLLVRQTKLEEIIDARTGSFPNLRAP